MKGLVFTKMHGGGNDFILIDNRTGVVGEDAAGLARMLCRRKFSVGADGLILIEPSNTADFRWRFYNADGSEAEMCGNGARCAARFAYLSGIAGPRLRFETQAGLIHGEVTDGRVRIGLSPPQNLVCDIIISVDGKPIKVHHVNTGVPHTILLTDDLDTAPVRELGRAIRFHERFAPAGTNVNFVQVFHPHSIRIRTYERGVEDETLACGTGAAASAIVTSHLSLTKSPVSVLTQGGEELTVHFTTGRDGRIEEVLLEGDAVRVYTGRIEE
ncbi:MAG: diaminopimelate epimerase [Deltaproteobacteria bacterium]